jgi:hypothetical protein
MAPKKSDDMKEILERLEKLDDTQQQTLWLLKGNPDLRIEGVMPALVRIEKDVHNINEWKNEQTLLKGKVDLTRIYQKAGFLGKGLIWVSGIGSGTFTVFELLKRVFE